MNLQEAVIYSSSKRSDKAITQLLLEELFHSESVLLSPEDFCLASDKESRLLFVEPASTSPSGGKLNATVPDEDPKKRRTAVESVDDDAVVLYAKTRMGWSNLQLGPNLQIPYRE